MSPPADGLAVGLLLGLLRGYKIFISPLFTGSCRYYPSCADYMKEALLLHGARKGTWLGLRRLARCHPFGRHGVDPVPPGLPERLGGVPPGLPERLSVPQR